MNQLDSVKAATRVITNEIYTMEVANVIAFYPESCTADVNLLLLNTTPNATPSETPLTLYDVPVRFPQMGNFVMYAPLQEGDAVYLHFSRRDWDNWLLNPSNNKISYPKSVEHHSKNCAYIEAGARNLANPAADSRFLDKVHMVQGDSGQQYITMSDEGIEINAGATKVTISNSGGIQIDPAGNVEITNGNVQVTGGDVIADGISLKNHTHGYVDDGNPAQTTPPIGGTP